MSLQDSDVTTNVRDLPEDHLFKLVYREGRLLGDHLWLVTRRPINIHPRYNIHAIVERLKTPEGKEETKQWIATSLYPRRLFIHQLCDWLFIHQDCDRVNGGDWGDGDNRDACVKIIELFLDALRLVIQAYPESIRIKDSNQSLPLHLVCDRRIMLEPNWRKSFKGRWNYGCKEAVFLLLKDYPESVTIISKGNYNSSALACIVCFKRILDANPGSVKQRNGDGLHSIHLAVRYCNKLNFEDILLPLLKISPETNRVKDFVSKLYPFAQALVGSASNLNTGFELLRRDPDLLEMHFENKSMAASAEPPMKRQRRSRSRRSSTTSSNNSNSGSNNSSSSATILSPSAAPPRRSSRNRNILRLNISYLGDNEMLMQSLSEEQQIKLAMAASMEDQQQN